MSNKIEEVMNRFYFEEFLNFSCLKINTVLY